MRYLPLCAFSIFISLNTNAQVTIQSGTTLTVMPETALTVDGDFTIDASGHLDNYGKLNFNRSLINNGNGMIDGELVAMGDASQFMYGLDSFSVNTLRLNNASGLELLSKVSVINTLELDKGVLYTDSTYPVQFLSTSASPNETVNGYINGTAIMSARNISSTFDFLGSTVSSESGNGVGKIGLTRTTGDAAIRMIGDDESIAAAWVFTDEDLDNNSSGGDISMEVSWLPAFDNNKDITTLGLYGNTSFDATKFQSLDLKTTYPTKVDAFTEMRSYKRSGLDFISRTFTLAGKNNLVSTVPKVHITTFPNPATDHINLLLENFESWADDVTIKLTDAYGKVFQQNVYLLNGNLVTITDIGFLPTGLYRLFISRGQLTKVVNFIKN